MRGPRTSPGPLDPEAGVPAQIVFLTAPGFENGAPGGSTFLKGPHLDFPKTLEVGARRRSNLNVHAPSASTTTAAAAATAATTATPPPTDQSFEGGPTVADPKPTHLS